MATKGTGVAEPIRESVWWDGKPLGPGHPGTSLFEKRAGEKGS